MKDRERDGMTTLRLKVTFPSLVLSVPRQKKTEYTTVRNRGAHIFHKHKSHLKVLDTKKVTLSKFPTENQTISGATIQNLVARAIWRSEFAEP